MPIEPTGTSSYVAPPTAVKPRSELNVETFMRLLTMQLANQNPLEPMNDRDFFAQMAQLGTVQGMDGLRRSMDVSQAAAVIGKVVTAVRPMTEGDTGSNDLVTGLARRLVVRNGEYYLGLEQDNGGIVEVKMSQVRQIDG